MGQASAYADGSGSGHPLTAGSGSPTQVVSIVPGDTDPDAGALHSTGVEYLTLPFPGSPTNFSIEMWVQTSGACTIWGSYPYCYGGIDGSGGMFFTIVGGSTYTTTGAFSDGNLHHLVWTFSIGTLAMYADGVAGYQRRWDFALQKELRTLSSQAVIVLKKLAEKAAREGKR